MAEPISVPDAKRHLRVDAATDDAIIGGYIASAREWVEDETGLFLTQRQVTEPIGAFRSNLRLRAWPIAADQPVTIGYRDAEGSDQTITTATLKNATRPGILYPALGSRWPSSASAISVTLTAGYPNADDVPASLKQAMLVMLTAFYEDREGGEMFANAEKTARSLCRRHKRRTL
jgi:uncharacterized phiE125 gp8 family phage protein